jgi:hypothetical protein
MRTLKFRAWDNDARKMHYGGFGVKSYGEAYDLGWRTPGDVMIEQYTGLEDQDGREIYEGDVVHFGSPFGDVAVVEWSPDRAAFCFNIFGDQVPLEESNLAHVTVFGNVHEDPGLVKLEQA